MKGKITQTSVLLLGVLLVTSTARLWGQAKASAQISGVISDPSGAVVPNATVTVTHTDTGLVRTTSSGTDGIYVVPNLPVGSYKLDVQAGGFSTYLQTGIVLEVGNNVVINVTLRVGGVNQQVSVTASAEMLQVQTTSVGQVMDERRVLDLPLNGRVATSLILLVGASADTTLLVTDISTNKDYATADGISVAGGQESSTSYRLDGGTHMDDFENINLPFPFPDALQEFSVQTTSLTAQWGLHTGAQVDAVTKSGTNQFHGDAFEFVRNGDANARDFFAATQDTLKRNQFGGTIGGPIKRDKLFGFFGYQGTRIRTAPPSSIAYVPTQAALSGDWSQLESAACQANGVAHTIKNPATGQPFANDYVNPSLYNQQALKMLQDVPTSSNPCGKITYGVPMPQSEDQYIGRVDWNQSAKNNFFGRYFFADYNTPGFFQNNFLLAQQGALDRAQSATLGDTYSFSPTTLNSAHLTWTRLAVTRGAGPDMKNFADFGVNVYQAIPNAMYVAVNGHFNVNCSTCAPATPRNNVAEGSDDIDLIRGRHHMSLGADWIHMEYLWQSFSQANGQFTFNGFASGDSLLDMMLGLPSDFNQGAFTKSQLRGNYVGAYFNDNIQLSKRLNVNFGLRWEPQLPVTELLNSVTHFSEAAFIAGTQSTQYVNAPPGLSFPGDPGIPRGFTYSKLSAFEPRVGLVWDPTGSGRQVVRLGYGAFFDLTAMGIYENVAQGAPWGSTIDLPSPAGGLTNPWQGYAGGDPFPLAYPPLKNAPFRSETSEWDTPLDSHPLYVHEWNLGYQRQVTPNWLFSADYMGNKSTHVWIAQDYDPAIYIPGTCNGAPCSTVANENQRRVLYLINPLAGAKISHVYAIDSGSNAEYDALLLKGQHRFSNHYTILGNYAWSHCISDGDHQAEFSFRSQNPFDRDADRGNCGFDFRHIFNLTFIAQTPRFANAWENRLLGNWQLSPIVAIHSGTWFDLLDGVDNSLSGVGFDRPNAIGNAYLRSTTGTRQWLNPSAFALSASGTYGNAGRNSVDGPGYYDIDAAVSRFFNITERQRVELRFEFFNLTNHVNFRTPDATVTDATFGQILSDVAPRILQFALKYTF